jgi:hypothetical protein
MPCPVYDDLQKQWEAAAWEDGRARDPGLQRARQMSGDAPVAWRKLAWSALLAIEFKRNSHVDDCALCLADGRPKLDSSHIRD